MQLILARFYLNLPTGRFLLWYFILKYKHQTHKKMGIWEITTIISSSFWLQVKKLHDFDMK